MLRGKHGSLACTQAAPALSAAGPRVLNTELSCQHGMRAGQAIAIGTYQPAEFYSIVFGGAGDKVSELVSYTSGVCEVSCCNPTKEAHYRF